MTKMQNIAHSQKNVEMSNMRNRENKSKWAQMQNHINAMRNNKQNEK